MMIAGGARAADDLIGAASRDHLWLIVGSGKSDSAFQLVHHHADEAAWHYRPQQLISKSPSAMAAWDASVWLVFAPRPSADRWQREVCSTEVALNPATGLYYTVPAGRLETLPSLPGAGRLAGLVATRHGPVALLLASSRNAMPSGAGPASSQPALERPMLLRLQRGGDKWEELALLPEFDGLDPALLAAAGPDGDQLVLLEAASDNSSRAMRYERQPDGTWTASSLPLEFRQIRSLTTVAGQVLAVLADRRTELVSLAYARPETVIFLTDVPAPQGKWRIDAFDDQLVLIERDRGNDLRLTARRIDPLSGEITEPGEFRRKPLTAGKLWAASLMLGLALAVVLVLVLVRPASAAAVSVDPARVLPLGRRLLGLAIDLAVGAVPTLLLLDCTPRDLLAIPMLTLDVSASGAGPYLMMVLISVAVSTALEAMTGRSIGGAVVGAEITGLDGAPPARWRLLVRGVPKVLILLAPPLGLLAFLNRHMQGLHDMVARTIVLAREEPTTQSPPEA